MINVQTYLKLNWIKNHKVNCRYMKTSTLIIPGYANSGPQHWQTLWEEKHPEYKRVHQKDWDHPTVNE